MNVKVRNLDTLAERQEEMKEDWAGRRRGRTTGQVVSNTWAEAEDTEFNIKRHDLLCHFCKKNVTVANKYTGEIRPCKGCRTRDAYLKNKYKKMSLRRYYAMMREQSGRCAICSVKKETDLVVDACPGIGHVRGLLCFRCNTLIRLVGEGDNVLKSAMEYLNKNSVQSGWYARNRFL